MAPLPVAAQQVSLNVPAQPATAGIPQFARQAGVQIISPAGLEGLRTRAVVGRFTVEDGLRQLLRGTGLYLKLRAGNVISLALNPRALRLRPSPTYSTRATRPRRPPDRISPPAAEPVEDIVVTGTLAPERRLDAGLAVTTATLDRIHEVAPNNTADLLKLAPGIWAETTGGATGANIFVRGFPTTGDAPFLTVQLDGAPIFPPTELAFSENTTLFRVDDMVDRVEILRGGTSPIFSNGQPGAIMNFIQRTGTPTIRGGLRLTTTDYGTRRIDGYLSGPLGPSTSFALGGFYRKSDGLRNTQYPADRGGQISANVSHQFSNGKILAYLRLTRDRNAFYTGVPLLADGQNALRALPGFDPIRDTLLGRDTRHLAIETGPRSLFPVDLSEGRGVDLLIGGTSLEWSSGPVQITDRLNVTMGTANTIGLFTGPVPETLAQYVEETVARSNANALIVAAVGRASSGQAVLAGSRMPVSSDRYVLTAGLWSINERITAVTNELRLSSNAVNDHRLTAGLYLSYSKSEDRRLLGNNLLLLAEPNARRIDLKLDNGVQATQAGFASASTNQIIGSSSSSNAALFVNDTWNISARTSLEVGIRFEHQALRGWIRNTVPGTDFDGNPLTLYNNNGALVLASTTALDDDAARLSWAAGVVHRLVQDHITVHARVNHGSNLQSFDKLRVGGKRSQSADVFEGGVDVTTGFARGSINVFVNRFQGLQFQRLLAAPDGTVGTIVLTGGARAAGFEMEAVISPTRRWNVELRGTLEDARYRGFGGNDDNRVVRQPNIQFSASPVYQTHIGDFPARARLTFSHVGMRFSDVENLQRLPAYDTIDAGLHVGSDRGLYADLVVQNLFNEFGLTEGNTRILGAALSSGPVIARPLFGRNVSASVGFRF